MAKDRAGDVAGAVPGRWKQPSALCLCPPVLPAHLLGHPVSPMHINHRCAIPPHAQRLGEDQAEEVATEKLKLFR